MTFQFRTDFGHTVFNSKYRNTANNCNTWPDLAETLVRSVCSKYLEPWEQKYLVKYITEMKFIPAGRYLYYAGRPVKFFNNCFAMIPEDSREGWAELGYNHFMGLMCGGGIGTYYGKIRPSGSKINKTGGEASGPLSLMYSMNEIGRNVRQGGARRSALYASLNYDHADIMQFIHAKDWTEEQIANKAKDFNSMAPLDMTNISVCYDTVDSLYHWSFEETVKSMIKTGEPGFSFNINKPDEVGRNACAEFITDRDSDLCNLGSLNLANINSQEELEFVTKLASKFLVCGSLEADLPYEKCYKVRNEARKIGLGLMGVHEWLLKRNSQYTVTGELHDWLKIYKEASKESADSLTNRLGVSGCVRYRSIAPAGTISIIAGTSSGIEPIFSVGTKRRYLSGDTWKYQYIVDPLAKQLIQEGVDPDSIETAADLAEDPERRIKFQADIQQYVDMGISSTINLPAYGTEFNNKDLVYTYINLFRKYAPELRGITCYPNGSRGGQPLTTVSYAEALENEGQEFEEKYNFLTESSCPSGACSV